MNPTLNHKAFQTAGCNPEQLEAVNLYVDGELHSKDQPALFAHLAVCSHCRQTLEAVMKFRRMSRQEYLTVPPIADDVFFERLARLKETSGLVDRVADRSPLWQARRAISLRSAVLVGAVLFLVGMMVPLHAPPPVQDTRVKGEEEVVQFQPIEVNTRETAVYVFYPGLTIEAQRMDQHPASESL